MIKSDRDCVGGKPRIEGRRIWVSHVVGNVEYDRLEEYLEDFDLEGEEEGIKEALEYCMDEECDEDYRNGRLVCYCQDCNENRDKRLQGEDLWKIAGKLYKKYF